MDPITGSDIYMELVCVTVWIPRPPSPSNPPPTQILRLPPGGDDVFFTVYA